MKILRKILKTTAIALGIFLLICLILGVYAVSVSRFKPPAITDSSVLKIETNHVDNSLYIIENDWIKKNEYGLYEMYVSGGPYERGVKNGKLSRQQIIDQEIAFTSQIKQMFPAMAT